ncbi:hypothetical protein C8F01DRAFT_1231579 [Mycena amicta]|nr:hypothetical protein C8F01DRAFT_1231579 [Mycena amicta]
MSWSENIYSAYAPFPDSDLYGDLLTVSSPTAANLPEEAWNSQFKLGRHTFHRRAARAEAEATNDNEVLDDAMPDAPLVDYNSSSPAPAPAPAPAHTTPVPVIPPPIFAAVVPLPFGGSSPFSEPVPDDNPFITSSDALPPPEDLVARAFGLDELVDTIVKTEDDEDDDFLAAALRNHSSPAAAASAPARAPSCLDTPTRPATTNESREATPRPALLKFKSLKKDTEFIDATRKLAREIVKLQGLLEQSQERTQYVQSMECGWTST